MTPYFAILAIIAKQPLIILCGMQCDLHMHVFGSTCKILTNIDFDE